MRLADVALAVILVVGLALFIRESSARSRAEAALAVATRDHKAARAASDSAVKALKAARDSATAELAELRVEREAALARATEAARAGRVTYQEIKEALPDTLFEVRHLVDRREEEHRTEVQALRVAIEAERRASQVFRAQLVGAERYIATLENERAKADLRIQALEDLRSPPPSTVEAVAAAVVVYEGATLLGATPLEGIVAGGLTFGVMKVGGQIVGWLF